MSSQIEVGTQVVPRWSQRSRRLLALLAAVALVYGLLVGTSSRALAAAYGTVKAATQKMKGPHLPPVYEQVGTYPVGMTLTLTCYVRGQRVSGWGGTSDLWYRISDGYYAADVDLYTGSDNPITGACSTGGGVIVRATTQRMTGPYLRPNFDQVGTYPSGSRIALSCYLWGQRVTGWGGTSNLWYKISDGYYAADVDLDTGSNNPITGACPTISITSFVSQTRGKVWANAAGTYAGECVSLVSQYLLRVYGIKSGAWGNAVDYRPGGSGGSQMSFQGFKWSSDRSFRDGDILVWQGGVGHIAIWYGGRLYDQNNSSHSPARSANSSPFFSAGYLGYWRK